MPISTYHAQQQLFNPDHCASKMPIMIESSNPSHIRRQAYSNTFGTIALLFWRIVVLLIGVALSICFAWATLKSLYLVHRGYTVFVIPLVFNAVVILLCSCHFAFMKLPTNKMEEVAAWKDLKCALCGLCTFDLFATFLFYPLAAVVVIIENLVYDGNIILPFIVIFPMVWMGTVVWILRKFFPISYETSVMSMFPCYCTCCCCC